MSRLVSTKASFAALVLAATVMSLGIAAQSKPPTLSYDELIKSQELYLGKEVRINAVWTYGFERTFLCSSDCKDTPKAWVDFVDEKDFCKVTSGKLKKLGKNVDNKAQVRVIGKLYSGGGYGHMGAYSLGFTISCVEKFQKIY